MFQRRVALRPLQKLRENLWPSAGWKRALQYTWRRLSRLPGTPHAVALGCAIGVFVSWTPFLGFHIMIAMALAWVFRGNMLASFIGTFFGTPVTFPIIWVSTYQLGNKILGYTEQAAPNDLTQMLFSGHALDLMLPVIVPMAVGSIPLGIGVGLIFYVIVRVAVSAFKARRAALLADRANLRAAAASFDAPESEQPPVPADDTTRERGAS